MEDYKAILDFFSKALWPGVAVFIFYKIHKPLGHFLSKFQIFKFKYGDSSVELTTPNTTGLDISPQQQSQGNEDREQTKIIPELCDSIWATKVYDLLKDNRQEEAEAEFESYFNTISDESKKFEENLIFLHMKYTITNDLTVIDDLLNIYKGGTSGNMSLLIVTTALCDIYTDLRQFKKSVEIIEESLLRTTDEKTKAILTRNLANALEKNGESMNALALLTRKLNEENITSECKNILYLTLSDIEKAIGNSVNSVLCYDKSLEYLPLDKDALFSSGYDASQIDFDGIAISNYTTLLKIDDKNSNAINNLAVIANEKNLNTIAIPLYTKAADKDNGLAMTNLGYLYLEAGFLELAREMANKVLAQSSPHENVHILVTDINKKEKEELEKWEVIKKDAYRNQENLRRFINNFYTKNEFSITNEWVVANNKKSQIDVSKNNEILTIKWEEEKSSLGIGNHTNIISLIGKMTNSSFIGTYNEKGETNSLLTGISPKTYPVFGYKDDNNFIFFRKDFESAWELKLRKQANSMYEY